VPGTTKLINIEFFGDISSKIGNVYILNIYFTQSNKVLVNYIPKWINECRWM